MMQRQERMFPLTESEQGPLFPRTFCVSLPEHQRNRRFVPTGQLVMLSCVLLLKDWHAPANTTVTPPNRDVEDLPRMFVRHI
ncbi:BQ5605_C006g04002 [Microbotryum silenes-dioicae]|uniref:BQ5605_C006g04002 protein n=1 Tax=Microbotryum silenes-dioicae TaxID=796604 RepID=A0A2X0P836_9BASI|nr:BQ5605_C006g04002 [Microbotryum silenes-dioicae]